MKADEPKLVRVSRAAHELGLHPFTVRKWIQAGKIQAIRVGNEARIPRSEIERLVGKRDGRLLVLFARVSGHGQKDDLDVQIQRLQAWAAAEHPTVHRIDDRIDFERRDITVPNTDRVPHGR